MNRVSNLLAISALLLAPVLAPMAANAADLSMRPAPAPVPAAVYNWTGLYVGVNGGWGWGRQDPLNLITSRFDRADFDINGGMVGGTFGAQIQQGYVVIGVEGDVDWADISGTRITTPAIAGIAQPITINVNTKTDALGTLRARAGVAVNNWLVYLSGGAAFAHASADGTTIGGVPCGTFGVLTNCSESHWRPGLAAGGGIEWGFHTNWTAKVEYLYVATVGSGVSTDHINTVRGGINYRFGAF